MYVLFTVNIIVNDIAYEFKYSNRSIIFFKSGDFMQVENGFIKEKGCYELIENNKDYKIFVVRNTDTSSGLIMINDQKKKAFFTFKRGNLCKNKIFNL